jgi:hypothetical protein
VADEGELSLLVGHIAMPCGLGCTRPGTPEGGGGWRGRGRSADRQGHTDGTKQSEDDDFVWSSSAFLCRMDGRPVSDEGAPAAPAAQLPSLVQMGSAVKEAGVSGGKWLIDELASTFGRSKAIGLRT